MFDDEGITFSMLVDITHRQCRQTVHVLNSTLLLHQLSTCSYTHRYHTFSVSFKQPDSVELLGVDETEPFQVVLLATPMYKLYCSCVEHTTNSAAKNVKIKF